MDPKIKDHCQGSNEDRKGNEIDNAVVNSSSHQQPEQVSKHTIAIVGRANVGKTSIFLRYALLSQQNLDEQINIRHHHEENASSFTKTLQQGNQAVEIEVWDFHNTEDGIYGHESSSGGTFNIMEEHRERVLAADTVVLVYQKNSKESKQYCKEVVQLLSPDQRILIVTNKCDLDDQPQQSQRSPSARFVLDRNSLNLYESLISTGGRNASTLNPESAQMSTVDRNRKYFRISAKTGLGLQQLFGEIESSAIPVQMASPVWQTALTPDFDTPIVPREMAGSVRTTTIFQDQQTYNRQQEKVCLQVTYLFVKIEVRFPTLNPKKGEYRIRNGREIQTVYSDHTISQLKDLRKQVRATRLELERWLTKLVAKNLIASSIFLEGQQKESDLEQFERFIQKRIAFSQKCEKRTNQLSKFLFCLTVACLIYLIMIYESKVDRYWQMNANDSQNKLLRFERRRVQGAIGEIRTHQRLLTQYRKNVKINLSRLERYQDKNIRSLQDQVNALALMIENKMTLVKSKYHNPTYLRVALMQYKLIETRLSTMHIIPQNQSSVNILMASKAIFEYEKLLVNVKEQALDLYDSITLITKAITDYALIYKKQKDPKATSWLQKRHLEFNQKIKTMVVDFREDVNQSQNLALKVGLLSVPLKSALKQLNDRPPIQDLVQVDQQYLRKQCEIACEILFRPQECSVLAQKGPQAHEKQLLLRSQEVISTLHQRLQYQTYARQNVILTYQPPSNLIGRLHSLQNRTQELIRLTQHYLTQINKLDYSVLPDIKTPATPAEKDLLSEYTESVCYGYQEYERIVSGTHLRKKKLRQAVIALIIVLPLFCLVQFYRNHRAKQRVDYTFRQKELENAQIYNYYEIEEQDECQEKMTNDQDGEAEVKVIEVDDDGEIAPMEGVDSSQSSPIFLRKDYSLQRKNLKDMLIKLEPVTDEVAHTFRDGANAGPLSADPNGQIKDARDRNQQRQSSDNQIKNQPEEPLSRQSINKLEANLPNLISVLKQILPKLEQLKNQDVLLCVGNNGSGKSAIVNSLIHGTESLQLVMKDQYVEVNGQMKKKVVRVIDCKDYDSEQKCRIGHDASVPHTFVPNILEDEQTGAVFIDLAGFNNSGDFSDLIQHFILRYICCQADRVRFLLLITVQSINEDRGSDAKKQFDNLMQMCSVSLKETSQAIQPVLSKIKPMDDVDVEQIKDILYTQLCNFAADGQVHDLDASLQSMDSAASSDTSRQYYKKDINDPNQFKSLEFGNFHGQNVGGQSQMGQGYDMFDFNYDISQKLKIYDPLGRDVPRAEPQSIPRETLLQVIKNKLVPIPGSQINQNLSVDLSNLLEKIISDSYQKCIQTIFEQIKQSENQNQEFEYSDKHLKDEESISQHWESLEFLWRNCVASDAERRLEKFRQIILRAEEVIERAKKSVDERLHSILEIQRELFRHYALNDFAGLAKEIIKSVEMIEMFENDKRDGGTQVNTNQQTEIAKLRQFKLNILKELSTDNQILFSFCYELLKCDPNQIHCQKILQEFIETPMLVDVILSNTWSEDEGKMTLKAGRGNSQSSFTIQGSDKQVIQFPQSQQYKAITMGSSHNKQQQMNSRIEFHLTETGFKIVNKSNYLAIRLGEDGQFNGVGDNIAISEPILAAAPSSTCSTWILEPVEARQNQQTRFNIYLNAFNVDRKPKLVRNHAMRKVVATTRDCEGYNDEGASTWNINANKF